MRRCRIARRYGLFVGERRAVRELLFPEASIRADLIVFPTIGHGDTPDMQEGFTRILTKSGRPVLLSPETPPALVDRKIALGRDGGMAAGHALTAAMPYLEKAEEVDILCVRRAQRALRSRR